MRPRRRPSRIAPGAPPGTLVHDAGAAPSEAVARRFGADDFSEAPLAVGADIAALREMPGALWIEVTGLADSELIAAIGRAFDLHELSLEDVFDPGERGKVETYDRYTFVVLKTLSMSSRVAAHQISMFLGDQFLITFQDIDHPAFEPVRERLRHGRGKIRDRGADYLAYALVDSVTDHYFPVVESFDDHLERVEDAVLEARDVDPIDLARTARQDLQVIRHAVWPARDAVTALLREDMTLITDETRVHLRDCYDHIVQLQEMIESSREIAASLLESYISRVSLRTNEVMRILTVIATIFIPLTFITGVYGMNFDRSSPLNMPELGWSFGYLFSLLLMLGVVVGSLLYFRKKGWFDDRTDNGRSPRNRPRGGDQPPV